MLWHHMLYWQEGMCRGQTVGVQELTPVENRNWDRLHLNWLDVLIHTVSSLIDRSQTSSVKSKHLFQPSYQVVMVHGVKSNWKVKSYQCHSYSVINPVGYVISNTLECSFSTVKRTISRLQLWMLTCDIYQMALISCLKLQEFNA